MRRFFSVLFVVLGISGCADDPGYYRTMLGTAAGATFVGVLGGIAGCMGQRNNNGECIGRVAAGATAAGLAVGMYRAEAQAAQNRQSLQIQYAQAMEQERMSRGLSRCSATKITQDGRQVSMNETCVGERQFVGYPTANGYGGW